MNSWNSGAAAPDGIPRWALATRIQTVEKGKFEVENALLLLLLSIGVLSCSKYTEQLLIKTTPMIIRENVPLPDLPTNRKSLNLATWFFMTAV